MNSEHKTKNMTMGKWQLARPYIVSQPYTNLFSLEEALKRGTIFADLYKPYINKESKFGKEENK
ncbi:spore coat associated protein CotJA [Maledivibacter halophilus]|uniref:Spore coat associated protein JA (CotJA) n=1 Tax=Maledivibacter halophilus TaxID=36842 RepID=A0A1T5MHQ7_9FIRM|nr:spore coat associated protein CotJA [Maledivibacter halophilus]SKC87776.1 Spore coat associated protein JA (CotJA) [Maledivibacter halophilus]